MKITFLVAFMFLIATAFACNASITNVVIGQTNNCPNGVSPEQAEVYVGETFYVCGNTYLNGELLLTGSINGKENTLMNDQTNIVNGKFSLRGTGTVKEHKYYYVDLTMEKPCEKQFKKIPVEIKTTCFMPPPSTIEAVPNVIKQGQSFTLQVKNAPTDLSMHVTGLTMPITALISKGGSWSQTFSSTECSALGSCVIRFEFTDSTHSLCKAETTTMVTVKAIDEVINQEEESNTMLIATFLVLLLGTGIALLLNRYL